MGVWNATCGVSSLPIRFGAVRAFLIALHPPTFGQDDYLYNPRSLATPVGLPVSGRYNAYGGIENISVGVAETRLFDEMRALHTRGELEFSNGLFPDDLATLLCEARDGCVTASVFACSTPSERRSLRLSLMLVDERVYVNVLSSVRATDHWEAQDYLVGRSRGPQDAQAAAVSDCEINPNLKPFLVDASGDTLDRFADLHDFEHALDLLRRFYVPATGTGSQSDSWELHAAIARETLRIATEPRDE